MSRWRVVAVAAATVTLLVVAAGGADASTRKAPSKFDPTCGSARAANRTVNGTLGSVTLHGTPKRIVALEFLFVDDLTQVGIKPIGIADDNNPEALIPPVKKLVGKYTSFGLRATPNLEAIAALHPDLIIADATRHAKIMSKLNAIAPTIALDSLQQAYLPGLHSAVVIGQLVNKCGAMRVRVQQDKLIMQRIKKVVPASYAKKRAMFVVSDKTLFNVHSSLAYTPSLLNAIGIGMANPLKPGKGVNAYIVMSLEDLVANNPDIIFIANYFPGTAVVDKFSQSPLWSTVSAVKNKQVFNVNPFLWSKARGLLAGELIAQQAVHLLLHKYVSIALPKVTSA